MRDTYVFLPLTRSILQPNDISSKIYVILAEDQHWTSPSTFTMKVLDSSPNYKYNGLSFMAISA